VSARGAGVGWRDPGHLDDHIAGVDDAKDVDLAAVLEPVDERGVADLGSAEGEDRDGRRVRDGGRRGCARRR
jgi:hypothetical protein